MKQALFFLLAATLVMSCHYRKGSGNIITQKRDVPSFKGVSAGGAFEVEIKTGSTIEVIVESDDNLIQDIETKVKNDVLEISSRNYNVSNGHFKVYVTAPEINFLKGSGAATVKAMNELKNADQIKVEGSGAATVIATVDAPIVDADASGASKLELSGRTRQYKVEASGSSTIKSAELKSENATIGTSGASSVHAHASIAIDAKASGASSVYYNGGATVRSNTSGAASIKQE